MQQQIQVAGSLSSEALNQFPAHPVATSVSQMLNVRVRQTMLAQHPPRNDPQYDEESGTPQSHAGPGAIVEMAICELLRACVMLSQIGRFGSN